MIEISRADLMAWKLSHCLCISIKSEYMCFLLGLTLRVWKECKVEEVTCESSQGDFSVGHMWPITALLKQPFGERPLQRFWVLGQLFNYICSMPCLNVFAFMSSQELEPTLPGGSSTPTWMAFQLCRNEDILLGCSPGSAPARQGCTLGCPLSNDLSVLELLARDAQGSTGTCQGVSVSRMCCCQYDVKEVELWDHYWPGSSQSLNHWAYILFHSLSFLFLSLNFSPLCSLAWKEIRDGAHGGRWMGSHWVSSWDKILEVTSTSPLLCLTAGCFQARYARKRFRIT